MGPGSRTPSGPAVPCRLHQQAGQKTAPDQAARPSNPLAMREPSTEDILTGALAARASSRVSPSKRPKRRFPVVNHSAHGQSVWLGARGSAGCCRPCCTSSRCPGTWHTSPATPCGGHSTSRPSPLPPPRTATSVTAPRSEDPFFDIVLSIGAGNSSPEPRLPRT